MSTTAQQIEYEQERIMNTYRYEITERDGTFHVTEADGPSAPATGEYSSFAEAKRAVEVVAEAHHGITDLEWESGEVEGTSYWVAEWDTNRSES